jgi:hypothetical protein
MDVRLAKTIRYDTDVVHHDMTSVASLATGRSQERIGVQGFLLDAIDLTHL